MKQYLIVPDIHCPYHDPKIVKLVSKIIKELNPDGLVQLGDAIDCWQISSYSKDPSRRNLLVDDIEDWKKILNEWTRHLKSGASIHLIEGNHEYRLSRYIASQCRDLHGLVPDWPTLLGLELRNKSGRHKWHWHKYTKWNSCIIGDCVLTHGFYYSQHVAMQSLLKYRCNIIFGHTHRFQYVSDGFHYACTIGHASNEKETAHQPTPTGWTQYLGILYRDNNGNTSFSPIKVNDGKAIINGKTISI